MTRSEKLVASGPNPVALAVTNSSNTWIALALFLKSFAAHLVLLVTLIAFICVLRNLLYDFRKDLPQPAAPFFVKHSK